MIDDSYKIFISISHHRIAYEYWQRDGENKLVPMPVGQWPAPLAFYCSDHGILIGEDAARAVHNGTSNAYANYFDILSEDNTYVIGGQSRPLRNLLLDASESIFREFYRNVLIRFGSLSDNRANMPLTIVCESDVKPHERAFLQGLFKDSGYNRVKVLDYDIFIEKYVKETLSHEYTCDKVLVAWTEGSDLTFTLFGVSGDDQPVQSTYEGLGVDPRKEYIKNLVWERIIGQNPWLDRTTEEDAIDKAASDFLSSSVPMVKDTLLMSDGQKYHYSLNRNSIEYIQSKDEVSLKDALEKFLNKCGIGNRSRVLLLLRGVAAGNAYFEQNLRGGFSKVIKSDGRLRENTMKLLISDELRTKDLDTPHHSPFPPVSTPFTSPEIAKEKKKKWRQIKAEANGKKRGGQTDVALQMLKDFLSECETLSGVEDLLSEIQSEIKSITPEIPQGSGNPEVLKKLEREWREQRAMCKGKVSAGKVSEAREILETFRKKISKTAGTESLLAKVDAELSRLNSTEVITTTKLPNPPKENHRSEPQKQKQPIDREPAFIIPQSQLKAARDKARAEGNVAKAKALSDIIRMERSVSIRKGSLEECRRNKDKVQIERIVKELDDYINLCQKGGVDPQEYAKLRMEYKRILK